MRKTELVVEKVLAVELAPESSLMNRDNVNIYRVWGGSFVGLIGILVLLHLFEMPPEWLMSGFVITPLAAWYGKHRASVLRRWQKSGMAATFGREVVLCQDAIRFADLLSTRTLVYQDERYDTIRLSEIDRVAIHVAAGVESSTSQYVFEMKNGSFRTFEARKLKRVELELIAWLEGKASEFGFKVVGAEAARETHPKRSPEP